MVKYKRNNVIFRIVISLLQILSFMNVYTFFSMNEDVDDFISLLILLVELITLLNIKDLIGEIDSFLDYCLLTAILFVRLNRLNGIIIIDPKNNVEVILVMVLLVLHISVIANAKFNKKQEIANHNAISDVMIEEYLHNKIVNFFKIDKKKESDTLIQKYIWITLPLFIGILLFVGKIFIDIKNIFSTEYVFDVASITIYIVLNIIFVFFNCIKIKIIEGKIVKDLFEVVLFLIGADLFVFAQRGYTRFQILVVVAYLCCHYIMNARNLIRRVETIGNEQKGM